ncbi:MAG TPA: enoyl-CoA hydratase/isomerase family protein [Labilithrix sp.]
MNTKTILLSGPGKNSLSTALMESTLRAVREAEGAALLLTGDGDAFSAGLNLKEVAELDVAGLGKFLGVLEELVQALYLHPGPTVAWVNGHAIAGGCVLAMCCDFRVMTPRDTARIGLNEVALGLKFPPRTMQMIKQRLMSPAIDRVVLEAALHAPREALALGLVDAIGEEADARAKIATLDSFPRGAYAASKLTLRSLHVPADEERRFRDETIPFWGSPEMKARMRAVLEKKR